MKLLSILLLLVGLTFGQMKPVEKDQRWKQIKPLATNCEDIKRIFQVEKCGDLVSFYDFKTYEITIVFSLGVNKWDPPKGMVKQAAIIFREGIKLEEFEDNLDSYEVKPISDLPGKVYYTNEKKGVELILIEANGEKWIRNLVLSPPVK